MRETPTAIIEYLAAHRSAYGPTVREVARAVGVSSARAHQLLITLRQDGYVTWQDGKPRTLRRTRKKVPA